MTQDVSGGELAVCTLLNAGVSQIFALYGGHLETLFQATATADIPASSPRRP